MKELIHVSCFIKDKPLETKDDLIILNAEAWRDAKQKKAHSVRIALNADLYLDCLSEVSNVEGETYLYFSTIDSWKALKKVFKNPDFSFYVENDFELLEETEKDMNTIKEF